MMVEMRVVITQGWWLCGDCTGVFIGVWACKGNGRDIGGRVIMR